MAAKSSRSARALCAVRGHRWSPHGHDWCLRCKRYDDDPEIDTAHNRWMRVTRWSPIRLSVRHGDARVNLRLPMSRFRALASVGARLHYKARRDDEKPGIWLWVELWRLHFWGGVGFLWLNEDGDNRTLLHFGASFETSGFSEHVCRWFGHDPGKPIGGATFCERCHEKIAERESVEGVIAA